MPPIIEPFVLEYTWSGTYGGRPWANVMHTVWSAAAADRTPANLLTAALAAEGAWDTNLGPSISDDVLLTNVRVADLDSAAGQIVNLASSEAGDGIGDPFPGNVSVLVTKETTHNRSQRNGRWYQVGAFESQTVAGAPNTLAAGAITALQGAFDGFLTAMSGAVALSTNVPVVLSRSATAPSGFTPIAITSMTVQATLATQRRRLRG